MNLKQLEVFYAIMTTGSVTAAARSLNVTQPAVSNALRHAEQRLKFRLFERRGGRLYPTPEASGLFADVGEIFGRVSTLNRVMQQMSDSNTGRVVVATSPTLVVEYLPRAIASASRRSPAVHVSVVASNTTQAVERVARREADMGIIYGPAEDPGIEAEDLLTTEIACAVRKDHPLAKKRVIKLSDFDGEQFISLGRHTRLGTLVYEVCNKAGLVLPQIGIEAGSSAVACLLVSEGAGIALVDAAIALSGKFEDLAFRPFRPKVRATIQLIYPRERPRSRAVMYFSDQLRSIRSRGNP